MIFQDQIAIRDAWGRHQFTGVFARAWIGIPGTGCWFMIKMERLQ